MSHLSNISVSIFLYYFLKTSKCFILMQTSLQLDIWLQSYEGFDNAKNNMKQRHLKTVFANISKTTSTTSDSFLLIMSHIAVIAVNTTTLYMCTLKSISLFIINISCDIPLLLTLHTDIWPTTSCTAFPQTVCSTFKSWKPLTTSIWKRFQDQRNFPTLPWSWQLTPIIAASMRVWSHPWCHLVQWCYPGPGLKCLNLQVSNNNNNNNTVFI